jgi:hypothetical protein
MSGYISWESYRNRHYSVDNLASLRREVRCNETDDLVAFITKDVVDEIQDDIALKLLIIGEGNMLSLNPWSY